jgi:hypothetical protein
MLVVRDHSAFEEKIERKNADDGQDGFDTARGSYRLPQRGNWDHIGFSIRMVTAVKLRSSKNYLCLSGVDMRLVRVVSCLYVCPPRSTRQSGEVVARVQTRGLTRGMATSEPCL